MALKSTPTSSPAPTATLDDWADVRFFLAAAREASFSGAARALGTDQSTVSRRIAALEAALGHRLFERGARTLACTAFGAQLVEPARAVERAVLALADAAHASEQGVRGRVRIALTEGLAQHVVVPFVLPALLQRFPELAIELLTSDQAVDLGRHEADLALRFFRTPKGPLVGQRVARLPVALLAAKTQLRRFAALPPRELPWIRYVHPAFEPPEARWLEAIGAPRARLECTSVETQLAAVRAGLGVAFASRAFLRVMPELAVLEGEGLPTPPPLEIFLATRATLRKVPRVAVVYEALVARLQALAAE